MTPAPGGREPLILRSDPPAPELPPPDLEQLVPWLAERLDALEELDAAARTRALSVLDGVDVLHRQALGRLVELISDLGGRGLLERIADDPQVRTVLDLYDLLPAGAAVPHAPDNGGAHAVSPAPSSSPLIGISSQPPSLRRPRWKVIGAPEDYPEGQIRGGALDAGPLLVVRIDGELYGYRDGCPPGSALLLVNGELEGHTIVCPWHGCRYDARSGRRADGGDARLPVVPVAVRDAEVRVAIGTEEVPA